MAEFPFGERIADIRTSIPGPQSRDLAERLRCVECRNITYLADDFPVFWERAAGANVTDADGNLFVDFTSAFGVASLGHAAPAVTNAIAAQLERLPHGMGDVHPPSIKVELLEKLASLFPEPGARTILCSSGAEAVEAAIKTAYLATKRPDLVIFEGAYHGLTYGTLAASGQPRFREPFARQLAKISHPVPLPDSIEISIRQIDAALHSAEIGAVLVEPIFGRAGVVVPPDGWLRAVRRLTEDAGVLLIADEMMTGFGRTGTRFAIDREGIVPDLLCVGKALTGALPFSACIGTEKAMAAWPPSDGEALHTSTFLGHPLGCAAALASIEEIDRRNLSARAEELGAIVRREIERWVTPNSVVTSVRGRGLMIGIELNRPGLAFECAKKALQRGLIVLPSGPLGNVVSLTPPLTIAESQLTWGLAALQETLVSLP
jgi:4-aminobutyrate aminotransferase-like enzyme